jgi:cytoskeletal protein CcmA (bactofilin family)
MTRNLRRGLALAAALLLVILATTMVLAKGELLGGKLRTGETVTVAREETIDGDLYILAGTATMEGTVEGDVVAMGGQVQVNGTVTGDVLAAGGTVAVAGTVEGDVRAAGGQVELSGAVGEDAVITGGQTRLLGGGTVDGDLIVAGGQVSVDGTVSGSIEGSAGTYGRTGPAPGGTEHVVVSPRDGAERETVAGDIVLDAIRQFVVVVLLGALILWLLPKALPAAEGQLRSRPGISALSGLLTCVSYFVFVIAAAILIILLAIIFGLLQIGPLVGIEVIAGLLSILTVTFLFVLGVAFLGDIVVGLTLAHAAVAGRTAAPSPSGGRWRELALLAAGAAVVVILTAIPIVGGLVKVAVVLFGLGAAALAAWHAWQVRRGRGATPPAMATAPEAGV